jgi:hypothetical protein
MPYRHDRNKKTAILEVYNDETPQGIAKRFCEMHQLSVDHQLCLEGEINRRIKKDQSKRILAASAQAPAPKAVQLSPPVTMPTSSSATAEITTGSWGNKGSPQRLLFHMQFGVKGGSRRVDVYEGIQPKQIAKEFCKLHRLGMEHAATLVRQIERKLDERGAAASSAVGIDARVVPEEDASVLQGGATGVIVTRQRDHIDTGSHRQDVAYPNLPRSNLKAKRRRLQQQPRSGSLLLIETPTTRPVETILPAMVDADASGGMLLYTLSVYINTVVHTMQVYKNAEILDMAKEFCERIGIDKEEDFILHLTVIDSVKRHHSQTVRLLKQGLPVMPLKIQF